MTCTPASLTARLNFHNIYSHTKYFQRLLRALKMIWPIGKVVSNFQMHILEANSHPWPSPSLAGTEDGAMDGPPVWQSDTRRMPLSEVGTRSAENDNKVQMS